MIKFTSSERNLTAHLYLACWLVGVSRRQLPRQPIMAHLRGALMLSATHQQGHVQCHYINPSNLQSVYSLPSAFALHTLISLGTY